MNSKGSKNGQSFKFIPGIYLFILIKPANTYERLTESNLIFFFTFLPFGGVRYTEIEQTNKEKQTKKTQTTKTTNS